MQLSQIDELQNVVFKELGFDGGLQEPTTEVSELVFGLLATHPSTGEMALGKIGRQLIELIAKLDLHHADAISLIEHIFSNDEGFQKQVLEAIELADRCKTLSSISSNFYRLIDRRKFSKPFFQTQFSIRLLKSIPERERARLERQSQTIDLKPFYKRGNEIWKSQPEDFSIFNRHNIPYIEHIEIAEKQASRYAELGCEVITDKITEEIKQLKASLRDRYYGFNRVKMTVAATVIAKMHGYKLRTSWDIHDNKVLNIIIPRNMIYDFEPDSKMPIAPFMQGFSSGEYYYEPRLYPVHEMMATASEDMLRVMDHLDNFPDINGKALFDNFLLLVPSVKLPHKYNGTYFVKDSDNILGFGKQDEAFKFLDTKLIESGSVLPVLFGERNGKCYFLCYWK